MTERRTLYIWSIILVLIALFPCALAYADGGDDFFIQRGVSTISGTSTTLIAGVDYTAPSASTSAFIRITNSHYTGSGPDTGSGTSNADDVTAYILDPWNIPSSVTIARGTSPSSNTRVAWEIIEYQGVVGGENELVVRQQQFRTYGDSATSLSGPSVAGVVSDEDIVVFITGQFNPDSGTEDYNTVLSTADWNSTTDTATFLRGEAGGDEVIVSYAVVEFTGSHWNVQRTVDHTYTSTGTTETEPITAIGSIARAFIHAQHRAGAGADTHADFGHEAWLSGVGQVSFRLDPDAATPANHVSAAWVIENMQAEGDTLKVTRSNGTQSGGSSPTTTAVSIGKTLDDLTVASLFIHNSGSGGGQSWPEPMLSARLTSTTTYEIWISDSGDSRNYRTEIVEWPTAVRSIAQNYYYFFVNNNVLTPIDAWPGGGGDIGENSEITESDDPLGLGDTIRIRMSLNISEAAMTPGVDAFKLQYAKRTSSCSAASAWRDLGEIGSTTSHWRGTTTPIADGATLDTLLISVSDVAGTFEEENDTALTPNLVPADDDVEFDWVIENNGAADDTDYCFRMVEDSGTGFDDYHFYPVIRTIGYGVESGEWRWYDDAENETPVIPLAASNTAPVDIAFNNEIQLRIVLPEVLGASGLNVKFRLQFSEYSDFSSSSLVTEIPDCVLGISLWCYSDGGGTDNATTTTALLSESDTCDSGIGAGCGTHNESGTSSTTSEHVHQSGDSEEYAFTIIHAGARVNRVYYFRLLDASDNEPVLTVSEATYPSLITEGASLSFSMAGISSTTVIDGESIDIDSSPSLIHFGNLPFNTKLSAAHRLQIDTNGTEGYRILMYSRGDFESLTGSRIEPVSGTNALPLAWDTGCDGSAYSCFGYHTTDPTLEGGSARFSASDTFARLSSTTAEEIAYSTSPTEGETTDIVYKLQITPAAYSGQYETNIVYLAVPLF